MHLWDVGRVNWALNRGGLGRIGPGAVVQVKMVWAEEESIDHFQGELDLAR
jgi:hypothetical protein